VDLDPFGRLGWVCAWRTSPWLRCAAQCRTNCSHRSTKGMTFWHDLNNPAPNTHRVVDRGTCMDSLKTNRWRSDDDLGGP
jgi:hypothetical protein